MFAALSLSPDNAGLPDTLPGSLVKPQRVKGKQADNLFIKHQPWCKRIHAGVVVVYIDLQAVQSTDGILKLSSRVPINMNCCDLMLALNKIYLTLQKIKQTMKALMGKKNKYK